MSDLRDVAAWCEDINSMVVGPTFVVTKIMDYRDTEGGPYFAPLVASLVMTYRTEIL